ncbi:MAG TPA: acyl-CoA dehydrogenase family protein [Acidimicrobiales bacterium]
MTTTTTAPGPTTAEDVLAGVDRLAPAIAARAPEIEAARRLPADLLADLAAAGCFRLVRPPSHGGLGADLSDALRVSEALARADGSVGWTVTIGATSWCDLAGLPRATFDAVFGGDADPVIAGVFSPSGTATPEGDGRFRVDGRWAFASGCEHATWLYANTIEAGDGPRMRTVLLAPEDVEIQDTWDALGLRGTGSHHFVADGVVLPAERTFLTFEGPPAVDVPVVRLPPPALYALLLSAVALGVAQGALDDVLAVAGERVPLLADRAMSGDPTFHHDLATADARLRAARALLYADAGAAWRSAQAGAPLAPEERARVRATAAWATATAVAVVDTAHHHGGGGAVYASSPLARRLRDAHAMAQHFLVRPDTFTTAGAVLSGMEVDLSIF